MLIKAVWPLGWDLNGQLSRFLVTFHFSDFGGCRRAPKVARKASQVPARWRRGFASATWYQRVPAAPKTRRGRAFAGPQATLLDLKGRFRRRVRPKPPQTTLLAGPPGRPSGLQQLPGGAGPLFTCRNEAARAPDSQKRVPARGGLFP